MSGEWKSERYGHPGDAHHLTRTPSVASQCRGFDALASPYTEGGRFYRATHTILQ